MATEHFVFGPDRKNRGYLLYIINARRRKGQRALRT
jgi:hypothetical protein